MKTSFFFLAGLLSLMLVTGARAAEKSPIFEHWSKFKVGSTSTAKGEMKSPAGTMQISMASTLKEVKDDHVKVEIKTIMTVEGKEVPSQPQTDIFHADPSKDKSKMEAKPAGKETIEVMGKKFECNVFTIHTTEEGLKSEMKAWLSEKIPGPAKMDVTMKAEGMDMTFKATVVSMEVK